MFLVEDCTKKLLSNAFFLLKQFQLLVIRKIVHKKLSFTLFTKHTTKKKLIKLCKHLVKKEVFFKSHIFYVSGDDVTMMLLIYFAGLKTRP